MAKKANPKKIPLRELLAHVATILEAPRDRLGRLDMVAYCASLNERTRAREEIRQLSITNCLTPSYDALEQVAKVIRVHLGEGK